VNRLSANHVKVGEALVDMVGTDGQCDPSHAAIAKRAKCHERTVGRALVRLAAFGLLLWQRRLISAGWRSEQTSNAYWFRPDAPLQPLVNSKKNKRLDFTASLSARAPAAADRGEAAPVLAEIAARQSALFAANWLKRRSGKQLL
jgi:hypothetical protein